MQHNKKLEMVSPSEILPSAQPVNTSETFINTLNTEI